MNRIEQIMAALIIGAVLDYMIGDPGQLWHPVKGMGSSITWNEKWIRRFFSGSDHFLVLGGALLVITLMIPSFFIPWLLLRVCYRWNLTAGILLEGFMCYQMFAAHSLKTESMKVEEALEHRGLEAGRNAVAMIVGRDTNNLTMQGVIKAAVETVAENTSDGVIAPMFYAMLGGAPLLYVYKAVNTMDSMVGYKNDTYLYFGRCAAKMDDLWNYVPARISAWFMILAGTLRGGSYRQICHIYKRDRRKHASPNSAQTEAVMAAILKIQLAGPASYFGKIVDKPTIGDGTREAEPGDIRKSCQVLYLTTAIGILVFLVALGLADLCFFRWGLIG